MWCSGASGAQADLWAAGSTAPLGQVPAASKSTGESSESSRSIIGSRASLEVIFVSQETSSRLKKKLKIIKSCLAFGELSNPQISSWIDFLQQCGLSYVKHFLAAIAEGGGLELEKSSPKSPSRLGAPDFFQHREFRSSWILVSCSGGHVLSLEGSF